MNKYTQEAELAKNKISNNTEKSAKNLPELVNLEKWEEVGYVWSGTITPRIMNRLVGVVPEAYQDEPIELKCELKKQGQLLTLVMDFSGDIWVNCQRCLQPLDIDVSHQAQLVLLQREEQESLVDESDDYLLLDELLEEQPENKKGDRFLPFKKLVEDELLLDVPLSAKHDDCEMAVEQVGEIIEEENENPFAALEALKGKL